MTARILTFINPSPVIEQTLPCLNAGTPGATPSHTPI